MNEERDAAERVLVASLKSRRIELTALLARQSDHWGFEDPIYRFYHQSFKVFTLQSQTEAIVTALAALVDVADGQAEVDDGGDSARRQRAWPLVDVAQLKLTSFFKYDIIST